MRATAAYAAKRELIDRLAAAAKVSGGPLDGWTVDYLRPGDIGQRAIYGGGSRFTSRESDASGLVVRQLITTAIYLRILDNAEPRDLEVEIEAAGDAAVSILADDPEWSDELSFGSVLGGFADVYLLDEQTEVVLALSLQLDAWVS